MSGHHHLQSPAITCNHHERAIITCSHLQSPAITTITAIMSGHLTCNRLIDELDAMEPGALARSHECRTCRLTSSHRRPDDGGEDAASAAERRLC